MVSAGSQHTLLIKTDGTLWSWGDNASGQLGLGDNTDRNSPEQIGSDNDWIFVSAGTSRSYAIKMNGTLWGWGNNMYGVLGDGLTVDRKTPIQIGRDNNWQTVSAGSGHTIAIKLDGSLWAWGQNIYENFGSFNASGQLGLDDSVTRFINVPTRVGTETDWKMISAGGFHSLAVKTDGTLWAWGANPHGELGNGTYWNGYKPKQIGFDNHWRTISAGWYYSLATKENGTLWGSGSNFWGQLGNSGASWNQNVVIQLGNDTNWKIALSGHQHSCGIKTDSSIWAWGVKEDGFSNPVGVDYTPVQVGAETTWNSLSLSWCHNVAIKTDGSIWGWGYAGSGALGTGSSGGFIVDLPKMIIGPDPNITPAIHIVGTANGTSVLVSSTIINGGSSPIYKWQDSTSNHPWQDIAGANGATLIYIPELTGDKLRCQVLGNTNCGMIDTQVSNVLTFKLDSNTIVISGRIYPNPAHSILNVDHIDPSLQWETVEIIGQNGTREYLEKIAGRTKITIDVQALPGGIYYVILKSKFTSPTHFKFMKL